MTNGAFAGGRFSQFAHSNIIFKNKMLREWICGCEDVDQLAARLATDKKALRRLCHNPSKHLEDLLLALPHELRAEFDWAELLSRGRARPELDEVFLRDIFPEQVERPERIPLPPPFSTPPPPPEWRARAWALATAMAASRNPAVLAVLRERAPPRMLARHEPFWANLAQNPCDAAMDFFFDETHFASMRGACDQRYGSDITVTSTFYYLSGNPHPRAVAFLRAHPRCVCAQRLARNPNTDAVWMFIKIQVLRHIKYLRSLQGPPPDRAVARRAPVLTGAGAFRDVCANPNPGALEFARRNPGFRDAMLLSCNHTPAALAFLVAHEDYIFWPCFLTSSDPTWLEFAASTPERTVRMQQFARILCSNPAPAALEFTKSLAMTAHHWIAMSRNPSEEAMAMLEERVASGDVSGDPLLLWPDLWMNEAAIVEFERPGPPLLK